MSGHTPGSFLVLLRGVSTSCLWLFFVLTFTPASFRFSNQAAKSLSEMILSLTSNGVSPHAGCEGSYISGNPKNCFNCWTAILAVSPESASEAEPSPHSEATILRKTRNYAIWSYVLSIQVMCTSASPSCPIRSTLPCVWLKM